MLYSFYHQHIALSDIFFADAIACAANAMFIVMRKSIHTRRDIRIGFGLMTIGLFLVAFLPHTRTLLYAFYILQVLGAITFYIPVNILYFKGVAEDARMRGMTLYWIVGIATGVAAPLVGALLYAHTSMMVFLIVPLLLTLCGVWMAQYVPEDIISYSRGDVFNYLKGLRVINALDGALHRVSGDAGFFVLMFASTVASYSSYLSCVSLVMAAVAWIVATKSDKTNNRMKYLWPTALLAGAATMGLSLAHSFITFLILSVVARASLVIAEPLRSNVTQDSAVAHAHIWISREFYINIGRTLLQIIAGILLVIGSPTAALILFGALHIAFPFLVHRKKIYKTV